MSIDDRLEALTVSLELLSRDVHDLQDTARLLLDTATRQAESTARLEATARLDGEHIRALVRIAELHDTK